MADLRHVYAQKALAQLPRLLGNQDRNPLSPTYGCFHRDYWLDKTSDFPDAVRQFAVHALALVYSYDFPNSIYQGQPKIRDWAIAGLDYWARIQHSDGSFDEFYPYERGWVGPTAFTTFTSIEAYRLLKDEIPPTIAQRVLTAIRKAAYLIIAGESEEDHLANHHAMACLATWKSYELLGDQALKDGFTRLWQGFLTYHHPEGWSREYDGVDPGYLSATVSFLAKIYQTNPDPALLKVMQESVSFSSYFAYPNGFYGGSMGSRNTLHFYAHGYEVMAGEIPLAAAVAEKMLQGLAQDKLVPPEIISDRYVVYRVPEFLQAYLDYTPRPAKLPPLPYEQTPGIRYFPGARVFVSTTPKHYVIANLAKGGVVKVFDRENGALLINDCGVLGSLDDGRVMTSQWVDPTAIAKADDQGWDVSGTLHIVPSNKLFSPLKNIIFRSALVALGWYAPFSHALKGGIRKTLMLGRRPVSIRYKRSLQLDAGRLQLVDTLQIIGKEQVQSLAIGDEFFVRYVPQSRYFQSQELDIRGWQAEPHHIAALNQGAVLVRTTHLDDTGASEITVQMEHRQQGTGAREASHALAPLASTTHTKTHAPTQDGQDIQKAYWESQRKRRHPTDPIVADFVQPKLAFVAQHITLPRTARILDVGCGNGYFTWYFDQFGETVGIDYSKAMLAMNPCEQLVQSSALELPFLDNSFDIVFCSNILHHIEDPAAVVAEMQRVSKRYVLIHEPNRNNPLMLALGIAKREERLSLQYTRSFVQELAQRVGLRILACETIGFITPNRLPRPIARLVGSMNEPTPLSAYIMLVSEKPRASYSLSANDLPYGVCRIDYHHGRQKKWQLIYRLRRRTAEVAAALAKVNANGTLKTVVDVGTADGLMLEALQRRFPTTRFIGIDRNFALLQARTVPTIGKLQGDAQGLPLATHAADAVIATAIIEHVPDPDRMIQECARVLRPGGVCILTTPDPALEHIASTIGLLKDAGHQTTFNLAGLQALLERNGFVIQEARKFMFSPIGFPAERDIEQVLGKLHLDVVMANQFVVGRKS